MPPLEIKFAGGGKTIGELLGAFAINNKSSHCLPLPEYLPAAVFDCGYRCAIKEHAVIRSSLRTQNVTGAGKIINDIAAGLGGSIPGLAASLLSPESGSYALFLQATGKAAEQALREGADNDTAMLFGLSIGGAEVMLSALSGAFTSDAGKGLVDPITQRAITQIVNDPAAQRSMQILMSGLGSGFGEFAEEYAKKYITDAVLPGSDTRNAQEVFSDAFYAAAMGALSDVVTAMSADALESILQKGPEEAARELEKRALNPEASQDIQFDVEKSVESDTILPEGQGADIIAEVEKSNSASAPSQSEMLSRAEKYQDVPDNYGVIADRIANEEYNLRYKHQKYLQHIEGTVQNKRAGEDRNKPQSILSITEQEAQEIIYQYSGTGIARIGKGKVTNVEFVNVGKTVGKYQEGGKWYDTERVMIVYASDGSHIVPVKPR